MAIHLIQRFPSTGCFKVTVQSLRTQAPESYSRSARSVTPPFYLGLGSGWALAGFRFSFFALTLAFLTAVVPFSGHIFIGGLKRFRLGKIRHPAISDHIQPRPMICHSSFFVWRARAFSYSLHVLQSNKISGQVWLFLELVSASPTPMGEQHCILYGVPPP